MVVLRKKNSRVIFYDGQPCDFDLGFVYHWEKIKGYANFQ
jgi:hypothetical protein